MFTPAGISRVGEIITNEVSYEPESRCVHVREHSLLEGDHRGSMRQGRQKVGLFPVVSKFVHKNHKL